SRAGRSARIQPYGCITAVSRAGGDDRRDVLRGARTLVRLRVGDRLAQRRKCLAKEAHVATLLGHHHPPAWRTEQRPARTQSWNRVLVVRLLGGRFPRRIDHPSTP